MTCRSCGNALPANATGCPRCTPSVPLDKTRRLSVADLHKTRALVGLDVCRNCGSMVYAAATECASCGAWIERPWQQAAKPKRKSASPVPQSRIVAMGIRHQRCRPQPDRAGPALYFALIAICVRAIQDLPPHSPVAVRRLSSEWRTEKWNDENHFGARRSTQSRSFVHGACARQPSHCGFLAVLSKCAVVLNSS